jgi:hypothetical protein
MTGLQVPKGPETACTVAETNTVGIRPRETFDKVSSSGGNVPELGPPSKAATIIKISIRMADVVDLSVSGLSGLMTY